MAIEDTTKTVSLCGSLVREYMHQFSGGTKFHNWGAARPGSRNTPEATLFYIKGVSKKQPKNGKWKAYRMCTKENQNNSSRSFLRNPSTLKSSLAHIWEEMAPPESDNLYKQKHFQISKQPKTCDSDYGCYIVITK